MASNVARNYLVELIHTVGHFLCFWDPGDVMVCDWILVVQISCTFCMKTGGSSVALCDWNPFRDLQTKKQLISCKEFQIGWFKEIEGKATETQQRWKRMISWFNKPDEDEETIDLWLWRITPAACYPLLVNTNARTSIWRTHDITGQSGNQLYNCQQNAHHALVFQASYVLMLLVSEVVISCLQLLQWNLSGNCVVFHSSYRIKGPRKKPRNTPAKSFWTDGNVFPLCGWE